MTSSCLSAGLAYRPLQWCHNERDGVSNHRRLDSLLNRLFGGWSKKTSKLRATGLCEDNPPVTGRFPSQRASNAENISICWHHHENPNSISTVHGDALAPISTRQSTSTEVQCWLHGYMFSMNFIWPALISKHFDVKNVIQYGRPNLAK